MANDSVYLRGLFTIMLRYLIFQNIILDCISTKVLAMEAYCGSHIQVFLQSQMALWTPA